MTQLDIYRLSLVRFATSFLVILIVGILNRIMIVELGISKILVASILAVQHLITPLALYFGFLSDNHRIRKRRRVPYIVIGMLLCCLPLPFLPDIALNISAGGDQTLFIWIGIASMFLFGFGVTVSTVSLHALIIDRCRPDQRGEAITAVWIITLVGFILAAPFFAWSMPHYNQDELRLIFILTSIFTLLLTFIGVRGQEKPVEEVMVRPRPQRFRFYKVIRAMFSNPHARVFFLFIALSDFFFFSQEYVLEAFGQEVFGLSVGHTTSFNLYWGIGILISMVGFNALFSLLPGMREKTVIVIGSTVASVSFILLAISALASVEALVLIAVFLMGFGKGIFNVGIARMVARVTRADIGGLIMGMWAVVGGVAIGLGELGGGVIVVFGSRLTGSITTGYGILFIIEAIGILLCLLLIVVFRMNKFQHELQSLIPHAMGE